jgi:hypothetical protein
MSSRDFAVVALGRFLVVERYRERCPSPSSGQLSGPGAARTGGYADWQDSSSGPRVPANEFPASRYARRHPGLRS